MKTISMAAVVLVFGLFQGCTIAPQKFTIAGSVEEIPAGAAASYLSSMPVVAADQQYRCRYSEGTINGDSASNWRIYEAIIRGAHGAKIAYIHLSNESGFCFPYAEREEHARDDFEKHYRPKMEKAIYALKALGVDVSEAVESSQEQEAR